MRRLPDVVLDDRRFQDLVNEARLRIAQSCPEWTDHNVSDPGITLIELFAWMTETLIYRVNRIPEKLHVTMLDLLGIRLDPPSEARADIRFQLAAPVEQPLVIPGGDTEVATRRRPGEEPVVFATTEDAVIPPARIVSYALERAGQAKEVAVGAGEARPRGSDQLAFASPPLIGDAICLGFDEALSRLLVEVEVDCSQARGAGVDPDDPPLVWEISSGAGWLPCSVLEDTTGGFNYGSGTVLLDLPGDHQELPIAGRRAFWIRCRLHSATRSGQPAAPFSHPPEIYAISAAPVGATVAAEHAARVRAEDLGESDGTPGQIFSLRHHPVLKLGGGETLEVQEPESADWVRWQVVESFAESDHDDEHFILDLASGQIEFGPAVRAPHGGFHQYGAVPAKGARLRMSRYRHGGGRDGNVAANALVQLKAAIPGVQLVTNPEPARGGVDAESLESGRERAALELRTRYRAVTAEDYEFLCGEASPRVARALCLPPDETGAVRVHIVPRVDNAEREIPLTELVPDTSLFTEVGAYLDERRTIGSRVELRPVLFRGVTVVANLVCTRGADATRVQAEAERALYRYVNPLVGGRIDGRGGGWEFGRGLNQGELHGVVQAVQGVEQVKILRVYETDLATGEQAGTAAPTLIPLDDGELFASARHIVKAEAQA